MPLAVHMVGGAGVSDSAAGYLAGNLCGQRAVAEVQAGLCEPDHLHNFLTAPPAASSPAYVRGLLRAVQKSLERLFERARQRSDG